MPDREKVIKGLECCIRKMEGQRVCDECPYDEDFNCLGCDDVLRQAIAQLREQEAVEPRGTDSGVRIDYACGYCGRWFCYKSRVHPEMDFRTKYCPHCGKAVKWDD